MKNCSPLSSIAAAQVSNSQNSAFLQSQQFPELLHTHIGEAQNDMKKELQLLNAFSHIPAKLFNTYYADCPEHYQQDILMIGSEAILEAIRLFDIKNTESFEKYLYKHASKAMQTFRRDVAKHTHIPLNEVFNPSVDTDWDDDKMDNNETPALNDFSDESDYSDTNCSYNYLYSGMTEREQKVLNSYAGLEGKEQTLKEIAQANQCSIQNVSQILKSARAKAELNYQLHLRQIG